MTASGWLAVMQDEICRFPCDNTRVVSRSLGGQIDSGSARLYFGKCSDKFIGFGLPVESNDFGIEIAQFGGDSSNLD